MTRLRIPRPLAISLGIGLFVSCVDPTGGCGCEPARDEAVLYGRVTSPSGAPVAGAQVRAQAGPNGCQQPLLEELGWTTTDANGRYRAHLHTTGGLRDCMRAFALPGAGSALRGSDTASFQVRFAYPKPTDSVRVDFVLRNP